MFISLSFLFHVFVLLLKLIWKDICYWFFYPKFSLPFSFFFLFVCVLTYNILHNKFDISSCFFLQLRYRQRNEYWQLLFFSLCAFQMEIYDFHFLNMFNFQCIFVSLNSMIFVSSVVSLRTSVTTFKVSFRVHNLQILQICK